jgi:hypothetical protein
MKATFTRMTLPVAVLLCGMWTSTSATAVTIYSDNFNTDTPGLNATPSGWSISNSNLNPPGTVDIIGSGGFGITCAGGSGNCVDLDGSTGRSGNLTSPGLNLLAGQSYTAFFDLSGNQRIAGQTNAVSITFGTTTDSLSFTGTAAFSTHSVSFEPSVTGTYHLSFLDNSNNNVGAILDNVSVQAAVPEPETYTIMLVALGLVGLVAHRRKAKRQ